MSNIKDQIVTLLKQRHHSHKVALDQEKDPRSKHAVDLIARIREDSQLIELIDSLPEDASCVYDTNKLTPTPSVNIEDVARVQFASYAHVFDRKRKAVFDWEHFKEVAGIFYGFGKRDSLPEEKPSEDLEEEIKSWQKEGLHFPWCSVSETIERTARHFAEWGRMRFRDTEKSQSFTSLEEAAKEYATTHLSNNEFPTADSAFIAGAKWQYKNTITFLSEVMFQDMKKGICGWGEIPEKK